MLDTNKYENALKNLQDEIEQRVSKIQLDLRQHESATSQSMEDQATELENADVLGRLLEEGQEELGLIHQALERINQDRYGRCTKCDSDIVEARLDAIPFTPFCSHCAH